MIALREAHPTIPEALYARIPLEVRYLADSVPERGERRPTILKLAVRAAQEGFTNHDIIRLAECLADYYEVYPDTNLYERYSRLLGVVRNARSHYPNPHKS
jgi:hypothetical protein